MTSSPEITLLELFARSAQLRPDHPAVEESDRCITYRDLATLSDRVCRHLRTMGVSRGDRVGVYLHKSIDAVAAIVGILKSGACYVPVDPTAPAERNAGILHDCAVQTAIVERQFSGALEIELAKLGANPPLFEIPGTGGGRSLEAELERHAKLDSQVASQDNSNPDDLAYILYTSGSTGRPKGVMLTHRNGTSFVEWCTDSLNLNQADRFSSHAPFHFDLSILDIFVPIQLGATVVLVTEETGKDPDRLAQYIADKQISVWYSTPSILTLLSEYGDLARFNYSSLHTILFAGEVFPVKHLRTLETRLPGRRYFNLYGPTETNVCTYHEIAVPIPEHRIEPFPIGRVCSQFEAKVIDENGCVVPTGQEGELCIRGPGVTKGYWNRLEETSRAFLADSHGPPWYKTGDLVTENSQEGYVYHGRRDRMVKKRGYRIELGEIEACLYRHSAVKEAAVVAVVDDAHGVRIKAFLSTVDGSKLSLIALKQFCANHLPLYMIPDLFSFHLALPKTSTEKTDYQQLQHWD